MQQLANEFTLTHPITIYHSDSDALLKQELNALIKKHVAAGESYDDFYCHISFINETHPYYILNYLRDLEVFYYRSLKDNLATSYTKNFHEIIDQLNELAVNQQIFIALDNSISYTLSPNLKSVELHNIFQNEQLIAVAAQIFHISRLKITPTVIFIDGIDYLKKSDHKWAIFINQFIPMLEKISTEMPALKIVMWMNSRECEAVYEAFTLKDRIKVPCILESPSVESSLTDTEILAIFNRGMGDNVTAALRCIANAAAHRAVEDFIKTK